MSKNTKKSWVLHIRCEVVKEVITDECTHNEAAKEPWDHAIQEREIHQNDWTLESIQENK